MASIRNFWHQMKEDEIMEFQNEYKSFKHLCINQFKYSWVGLMKIKAIYKTQHVFSQFLADELEKIILSKLKLVHLQQNVDSKSILLIFIVETI